jgi:hypothetical protein
MATDRERLVELLTDFGVGFEEGMWEITCSEGNAKIDGYPFYFTCFEFDMDGKFVEMGAWE